jgi:hypothetical protein
LKKVPILKWVLRPFSISIYNVNEKPSKKSAADFPAALKNSKPKLSRDSTAPETARGIEPPHKQKTLHENPYTLPREPSENRGQLFSIFYKKIL